MRIRGSGGSGRLWPTIAAKNVEIQLIFVGNQGGYGRPFPMYQVAVGLRSPPGPQTVRSSSKGVATRRTPSADMARCASH